MNYEPLTTAIAAYLQSHTDVPSAGLTFTIEFHSPDKGHAPRWRTAACRLDHDSATQYIHMEHPTYYTLFDEWFNGGGDEYGEGGEKEAIIEYVSIEER